MSCEGSDELANVHINLMCSNYVDFVLKLLDSDNPD